MWHPFRSAPPRPEAPTWEDMLVEMRGQVWLNGFANLWKCDVSVAVVCGKLEIQGRGKRPSDAVYDAYATYERIKAASE